MSLSKELKAGVLVTAALGIFFIGFYFLKGSNLFSNNKEYYCLYDNAEGLQNSANVLVRGMVVGHVSAMKLVDNKGVQIELSMNKNIEIPEGTVASIGSADLLGTKIINLTPGAGPAMLPSGANLPTKTEKGMLDGVTSELNPRLQELKVTIAGIDTALASINEILVPVKTTANNLAALTGTLNQQSGDIKDIMHNLNKFSTGLAGQTDTIKQMLSRLNNVSGQLANSPIQKTVADLQSMTAQLKTVINKINSDQGSLGLLINNKDLYNNLNSSVNSIQKLTDDLKAHPSRYINITVFGKKKS